MDVRRFHEEIFRVLWWVVWECLKSACSKLGSKCKRHRVQEIVSV
jgi:hypothetical protein